MVRNRAFSVVLLLVLCSIPAFAGDLTAFDPGNVVIIAPGEAPVSIASFDGFSDGKKLCIHFVVRNETTAVIDAARVAMMVFDADRNVIGAATHQAAGRAKAGETFPGGFELPLMKPIESAWQIMVVPVEASMAAESGWRIPPPALKPLVERLRGSRWTGAQQALALGQDLIPRGELVQTSSPNCTIAQCLAHNRTCYEYCYDAIACAYCDRRDTPEGCSMTCYCVGPGQACPPSPYL